MPIEELSESFFRVIWNILKYFIFDIIIEIGVRFPGYLIIKYFWYPNWKKNIDSDSISVFIAGVMFWLFVIFTMIFYNS